MKIDFYQPRWFVTIKALPTKLGTSKNISLMVGLLRPVTSTGRWSNPRQTIRRLPRHSEGTVNVQALSKRWSQLYAESLKLWRGEMLQSLMWFWNR